MYVFIHAMLGGIVYSTPWGGKTNKGSAFIWENEYLTLKPMGASVQVAREQGLAVNTEPGKTHDKTHTLHVSYHGQACHFH